MIRYEDPNALQGDALKDYWASLLDRRMDERYEVERLISVLKGHYFSWCMEHKTFDQNHEKGIIEFHGEKRPYGHKNIAQSIIFNLGWDYKRQLCFHSTPKDIEQVAMDLHAKVLVEFEENMFLCL